MYDKQVYELTLDDLARHGVWFFPMDESVEDELTVRPLLEPDVCGNLQTIVRARFLGRDGSKYSGYLYWNVSGRLEHLKPVILFEDGAAITFWDGIIKPSWDSYPERAKSLRSVLPITYVSEALMGHPEMYGKIEGLGYFDGNRNAFIT